MKIKRPELLDEIPLWRSLLALCWRTRRWLTLATIIVLVIDSCALVGVGLALRTVVSATETGTVQAIELGAIGAAVGYTVMLVFNELAVTLRSWLVQIVAFEVVGPELNAELLGVDTLEHLERSDFQDRLTLAHSRVWNVVDSAWAAVEALSFVLRAALSLALLSSVSPVLLILFPAAAIPIAVGRRGKLATRRAYFAGAEDERLRRHLFGLAVDPTAGQEILTAGVGPELIHRLAEAAERAERPRIAAAWRAAAWDALGWGTFTLCFIAALAYEIVSHTAGDGAAHYSQSGDIVLTVTVGMQLRSLVEQAAARSTDAAARASQLAAYRWLRSHLSEFGGAKATATAPRTLREGIRFEDVGYRYPGTEKAAVQGLDVLIPAGSVVAVVGEHGSGKSTVVKLLSKLYAPDTGRILVDGVDLAETDTASWRGRMSAAFQDFGRYCTTVADAVGIGDLEAARGPRGAEAVAEAIETADARRFVERLPEGAQTELGRRFAGHELSEGQWQKVALARASMRPAPLLFVLDEPTASLDAPSEHKIFERYMQRARTIAERSGGITLIVSHRFSTVSGADLILVMERGRLIEAGTHGELLAAQTSTYAQLYGLQATAYA